MTIAYKAYRGAVMIGKRYCQVKPGYLPSGPVTTFWHRNASWSAIAPYLVKTDYKRETFAYKSVFRGTSPAPYLGCSRPVAYRRTVFGVCTTRELTGQSHGYRALFITADNSVLCARCATVQATRRDRGDYSRIVRVVGYQEGPTINCDHCYCFLDSDYGDPNAESED